MKFKYLLGVLFASLAISATSCNLVTIDPNPDPLPEVVYKSISITNKVDLEAEWNVGDSVRTLELKTDPVSNVSKLLAEGKITIESSNPDIISINKLEITALKAGTSTISVKLDTFIDTVNLIVSDKIVKYSSIADMLNSYFDPQTNLWDNTKIGKAQLDVAVAAVADSDIVVTDGVNFITTFAKDGLTPAIGSNYTLTGDPTTYYGVPQITNRVLTPLQTNNITIPPYKVGDNATLHELKNKDFKNESILLPTKDNYFIPEAYTFTGVYKGLTLISVGDLDIRTNNEITSTTEVFNPGDVIKIHGILTTFNTKYQNFRLTNNADAELVERGVALERVYFDSSLIPTQCMAPFATDDVIKFLPESATAAEHLVEYWDPNKILSVCGHNFIANKPGTVELTPYINYGKVNQFKGETLSITFDGVASNIITNRVVKTIPELDAMDPTISVTNEIYEVEGKLVEYVNNDFGNITIEDDLGNRLTTYGLSSNFSSIRLDSNGNILRYTNTRTFLSELYGYKFNLNDKIKIAIFSDSWNGAKSYKAVFLEKVEAAPLEPATLTIQAGNSTTSIDSIVDTKTWVPGDVQDVTIIPNQGYAIDSVSLTHGTLTKLEGNTYRITFGPGAHILKINTKTIGNYELIASFDLSTIAGLAGSRFSDVDPLLNYLTNSVTTTGVYFESAVVSEQGVEKACITQGPKVGGLKLNNKNADRDVHVNLNLPVEFTYDRVELTTRSWNGDTPFNDFILTINGTQYQNPASLNEIKVTADGVDLSNINIVATSGRIIITKIELFNKL